MEVSSSTALALFVRTSYTKNTHTAQQQSKSANSNKFSAIILIEPTTHTIQETGKNKLSQLSLPLVLTQFWCNRFD